MSAREPLWYNLRTPRGPPIPGRETLRYIVNVETLFVRSANDSLTEGDSRSQLSRVSRLL
jgi:hypothetical protein